MISVSQIKTAKQCLRKWGFRALARLPSVPSPAMQFGIDGHEQIERWLDHGIVPDQLTPFGRLAVGGLPLLPRPGEALVEVDFTGAKKGEGHRPVEIEGVPMVGYIDVLGIRDGLPCVWDHKFTGRPDMAFTSETLVDDVQAITYGHVALRLLPADAVRLCWVYYPRNSKRVVFPVDATLGRDDVRDRFRKRVLPMAKLLHKIRESGGQWDAQIVNERIPCDPAGCDFSGRFCDYSQHCSFR